MPVTVNGPAIGQSGAVSGAGIDAVASTAAELVAAIAAVPAGGRIMVTADLTVTPAAGTAAFTIPKSLQIRFDSGPGGTSRRIYNEGDGDVFASSIAAGAVGQVNGVEFWYPHITRSAGVSAGKAFNMHGAWHWGIHKPHIANHAHGIWLNADPYPNGQCSHNKVWGGVITGCTVGITNTGDANINEFHGLNISNCGIAVDHVSGLNPCFFGLKVENLAGSTNPQIRTASNGLQIYGLHLEGKEANPAIELQSACTGTVIFGDAYVTTGVLYTIGANSRYTIKLGGGPVATNHFTQAEKQIHSRVPDTTATDTYTIATIPMDGWIRAITVTPDYFVNFSTGNYWTLQLEEWNGNNKVGNIGSLYTQSAQMGLGPITLASSLQQSIGANRTVRVVMTKVGAATTFYRPTFAVHWSVKP